MGKYFLTSKFWDGQTGLTADLSETSWVNTYVAINISFLFKQIMDRRKILRDDGKISQKTMYSENYLIFREYYGVWNPSAFPDSQFDGKKACKKVQFLRHRTDLWLSPIITGCLRYCPNFQKPKWELGRTKFAISTQL